MTRPKKVWVLLSYWDDGSGRPAAHRVYDDEKAAARDVALLTALAPGRSIVLSEAEFFGLPSWADMRGSGDVPP